MRIVMESPQGNSQKDKAGELKEERAEDALKRDKPNGMTLLQRLGYFWDYHKWKVLVPAIILVFAVSMITSYRKEAKELTLYIAMMNAHMDSPEDVDFGEQYAADRQIDTQKLPVRMETNLYHPRPEISAVDETGIASIQKYQALLTNGNVDVTITTSWVIDEYGKAGCYLDLSKVLPLPLLDSVSEKLYYAADGSGNKVPVGIYVDQTKTMKRFYTEEKPIVTISAFSGRTDAAIDFITWLLAN